MLLLKTVLNYLNLILKLFENFKKMQQIYNHIGSSGNKRTLIVFASDLFVFVLYIIYETTSLS